MIHPDDAKLLDARTQCDFDLHKTPEEQAALGFISGVSRGIKCLRDVLSGKVLDDHNGRRRKARARKAAFIIAGLLEESRIDDPEQMRRLRRDGFWIGSVMLKVRRFALRAAFWNRGLLFDLDRPDFYELGKEVLGMDGGESLEDILEAIRQKFRLYREPPSISQPSPHLTEPVTAEKEIQPAIEGKREYSLSYAEYLWIKSRVKRSELKPVAGRAAAFKRRGDAQGLIALLDGIHRGRKLTKAARKPGVVREKAGGLVTSTVLSIMVGASDVLTALGRIGEFMADGVISSMA